MMEPSLRLPNSSFIPIIILGISSHLRYVFSGFLFPARLIFLFEFYLWLIIIELKIQKHPFIHLYCKRGNIIATRALVLGLVCSGRGHVG